MHLFRDIAWFEESSVGLAMHPAPKAFEADRLRGVEPPRATPGPVWAPSEVPILHVREAPERHLEDAGLFYAQNQKRRLKEV